MSGLDGRGHGDLGEEAGGGLGHGAELLHELDAAGEARYGLVFGALALGDGWDTERGSAGHDASPGAHAQARHIRCPSVSTWPSATVMFSQCQHQGAVSA